MKIKNPIEVEHTKEKLHKRNKDINNENIIKFENFKEEKFSDKNFIIKNLQLEKEALKNKLEVKSI